MGMTRCKRCNDGTFIADWPLLADGSLCPRCAAAEIERLQASIDDACKQLHGTSQSILAGDDGLAAATWRDNRRLVKRCDEEQSNRERLQAIVTELAIRSESTCVCIELRQAAAEAAKGGE